MVFKCTCSGFHKKNFFYKNDIKISIRKVVWRSGFWRHFVIWNVFNIEMKIGRFYKDIFLHAEITFRGIFLEICKVVKLIFSKNILKILKISLFYKEVYFSTLLSQMERNITFTRLLNDKKCRIYTI